MQEQEIGCLIIRSNNSAKILKAIMNIHGYNIEDVSKKFNTPGAEIQEWINKEEAPDWAINFLSETLKLKLDLLGSMIKFKKANFLTSEIEATQAQIEDLRAGFTDLPQNNIQIDLQAFIDEEKRSNSSILANIERELSINLNMLIKHSEN